MEIFTIQEFEAEKFTQQVNKYLNNGWHRDGEAHVQTVAELSTYDTGISSHSKTTFVQVMRKL